MPDPVVLSEEQKPLLELIREKHPEATEREAFLLEHLIGAMGMVKELMDKRGGIYSRDLAQDKDAFTQFNEWLDEQYGWKLRWDK